MIPDSLYQAIVNYIDSLRSDILVSIAEHVNNQGTAKDLEQILSLYPEIEYEYQPEDCSHDYCTSKCTGCGSEFG